MTTFNKIIQAIQPFGLPHRPDIYEGNAKNGWFTYNYADDRGADFADDGPDAVLVTVQVHLFLPVETDYIAMKNNVRKALYQQGFTFSEISYFVEDNWRHIVFECDILEEDAL